MLKATNVLHAMQVGPVSFRMNSCYNVTPHAAAEPYLQAVQFCREILNAVKQACHTSSSVRDKELANASSLLQQSQD